MFQIFASTCDTLHDPIIADIEFELDIDARTARAHIDGVVDMRGAPILNPITGAEHRVRIEQPNGFEFAVAEIGRGWSTARGPVSYELAERRPVRLASTSVRAAWCASDGARARKSAAARARHYLGRTGDLDVACMAVGVRRCRHRHEHHRHDHVAIPAAAPKHRCAGRLGARCWLTMLGMWWVMMIAMMVPSAAPVILLHARVARHDQVRGGPPVVPRRQRSWPAISSAGSGSARSLRCCSSDLNPSACSTE